MRRPIIAGNWKMHKTGAEAAAFVAALAPAAAERGDVDVLVCPPFTAIAPAAQAAQATRIGIGAQDVFWRAQGAYTGEVSAPMLLAAGCAYCIVGHSERRGRFGVPEADTPAAALAVFGDSDASVNLKTRALLQH